MGTMVGGPRPLRRKLPDGTGSSPTSAPVSESPAGHNEIETMR